MILVCRICLEEIVDKNYVAINGNSDTTIQKELLFCVPELNINLIPNAIMCMYCVQSLYAAYNFKIKSIQNEKTIYKYIQGTILPDLEKMMLEIKSDNHIDVVRDIKQNVELVYIREDNIVDEESCEGGVKVKCPEVEVEPVNSFLDSQCKVSEPVLKIKRSKVPPSTIWNGQDSCNSNQIKVPRSYTCSQCSFSSKRSFLLKKHVTFSHNKVKAKRKNVLNCNFCKFTTYSKSKLYLHTNTHKSQENIYKCSKCNFSTSFKHVNTIHQKTHNQKYGKSKKLLECSKCSFKTFIKTKYDRHTKNHLEKSFKCNKCNYQAKTLTKFRQHSCVHSTSTSKCSVCKFECLESTILAEHMKIHKSNKQFKCTYCSFANSSKHNFDTHLLIHTGEKPFSCKWCDYKAIQIPHINNHMKFHIGSRPYKCKKCSYNVLSWNKLESHVTNHHNK